MLIQSAILKKPSHDNSEDYIGYHNGYFWLLDGATPPNLKNNKELTQTYLKLLCSYLYKYSYKNFDLDKLLYKSIKKTVSKIKKYYNVIDDYYPSSTVILVKITNKVDYLVLGDSTLLIEIGDKKYSFSDERLKQIAIKERNIVRELRQCSIQENSEIYNKARINLIKEEQKNMNKKNGYWIASSNPKAAYQAITGSINISNKKFSILLMSDGLSRLSTLFEKPKNIFNIIDEINQLGAHKIFQKLRTLEKDKNNFKRPVSSTHDDASYILIQNIYNKSLDDE